ncbi:carbohydrate kinase family protein [Georgenia sp. M64]|uniref:carbohydrate kinase family protein n=1 Tax=Georgenia sp. M64 TaxID=3120520 RepID=UPI0030DFCC83
MSTSEIQVPTGRHLDPNSTVSDLLPALPAPREHDVVVVGDTGVDLMVRVDALPGRDEKAIGEHLGVFGGGMGANFAVAATRALPGARLALVSRVGSDAFGRQCLADLEARGVDTRHVHVEQGGVTWWCAVALDATGEKALLGARTPASLPRRTDVSLDLLQGTRLLHVLGDISFSAELIDIARLHGALASVDIEGSFVRDDTARARQLATDADIVVTNAGGARGLTGFEDPALAAADMLRVGVPGRARLVVLTLGSGGALVVHGDGTGAWRALRQPARPVGVVDSTGAGDSFAGTFVACLLAGHPIGPTMARAAEAAAVTLGVVGSRGALLTTA